MKTKALIYFLTYLLFFSCKNNDSVLKQEPKLDIILMEDNLKIIDTSSYVYGIERMNFSCTNIFSKDFKSIFPDFKIINDSVFIINRQNNSLFELSLKTRNILSNKNINNLIIKYGGTPQSLSVNNKFIIIQLRNGLMIYNRKNKKDYFFEIKGEILFDLDDESLILHNDSTKKISIYKISKDASIKLVDNKQKINIEYFSRLYSENENLYYTDFSENNLYKYNLKNKSQEKIINLKEIINEKYEFFLEDVQGDKFLFFGYSEDETKVFEVNFLTKKVKEINLNNCISINEHRLYEDDQCDFNKPVCTSIRLLESGNILMLYSHENTTSIDKIIKR